ncbi:MAG: ComF family protein [Candidatus Magasanikbacteria bacterium]|nr:ComF family protein [Candidatus Magasanikbacteria bacterium]
MIIKLVKDILFPVYCAECGKEGVWWCEKCFEKQKISPVLRCPGCGKQNSGELCLGCRGFFNLDGVSALMSYTEAEPSAKLIRDFKYKYAHDIQSVWQMLIGRYLSGIPIPEEGVILPVPLFPRRERERGFNQAKILADIIYQEIKKIFPQRKYEVNDSILSRLRATAQQAKLTKEEREINVDGAFAVKSDAVPNSVILVDDVYTTGATLNECAKVLKIGGSKTVWAITLARAI